MLFIDSWLMKIEAEVRPEGRPLVSLCYAQSLDGSLAARRGRPLALSGPESLRLTHRLRAAHDAILVGVGAVLADNPSLTVRLVEGRNPQPVVLDSHLRFPLGSQLLNRPAGAPPVWIATTPEADLHRADALKSAGARLLTLPAGEGGQVSLPALLACLQEAGITRLMVEGGARVLTSFLAQELASCAVVTLAPVFVGGLRAVERRLGDGQHLPFPRLYSLHYEQLGDDLIVYGSFRPLKK